LVPQSKILNASSLFNRVGIADMATQPASLVDVLTLKPGEQADHFIGSAEAYGVIGIYGGHFLGQALAAALATIEPNKLANSLHGYFLRPGMPQVPIIYQVNRLRDGRGFATRTVTAYQQAKPVFHMSASFKVFEPGDEHQKTMPAVLPAAALIERREAAGIPPFQFPMTADGRVDMEWASESFNPAQFVAGRTPCLQTWMRANVPNDIDARLSQCVLAFLSDGTLMFNAVLPYGLPFQSHRLTSLDQAVWFHRPCNPADWLLFDQRSTAAADSRGMNEGEVYAADGQLILTVAQESMLRRNVNPA
jgi:acyl-CoA thioesterase II